MVKVDNQRPTWDNLPEIKVSDGVVAAKLASEFFGEPIEWQEYVLTALLARDEDDKYQFHAIALTVPRQNGKSWDVLARCLYGLVADGERILYTCQHGDTSDEMFRRLSEIFEDDENEALKDLLKNVRKTNGQQAIYLKNGGYIRFTTRTNSLARGKSYDVIIYDEAQELTESQQAASLFAISASRKHNTQIIYLGTPPDPSCTGDVFTHLHDAAHEGEKGAIPWIEWGVSEIGDIYDKKRWRRVNPSLNKLIDETAIEGELTTSKDTFARERLGWWSKHVKHTAAIVPGDWEKTSIKAIGDAYRSKSALAVKFSMDGSRFTVSGCKSNGKGEFAIEVVKAGTTEDGTKQLAEYLFERASEHSCVVIDGLAGSDALCEHLSELKAPRGYVIRPSGGNVSAATTGFVDGLADGSVKHTKQSSLDESAKHSIKRPIGQKGGWGFDCPMPYDSTPIESAALALWGIRNTKRNPKRKQRLL